MLRQITQLTDYLANPLKDIEVFGMFGAGNLGDEAMLVAARQVLGNTRTLSWKHYRNPVLNGLVRRRKHQHLLVSGGTLIHGGQTGWLDYVEFRAKQGANVTVFGTGMSFTDQQIHEQSDSFRRWAKILRNTPELHLRGPRSVALARDEMGTEQADIFGDFALMLYDPSIPLTQHDQRDDIIGINLGECLGDQDAFERSATELIRKLKDRHRIVFHAVIASDVPVIERVAANAGLSGITLHRDFHDPNSFMRKVRNYRAFLGLKLHAATLAMMAGVPSLMIAYKPKAYDLMEGLNAGQHLLVDLPLDLDEIHYKLDQLLHDPASAILTDQVAALSAWQKTKLAAAFAR